MERQMVSRVSIHIYDTQAAIARDGSDRTGHENGLVTEESTNGEQCQGTAERNPPSGPNSVDDGRQRRDGQSRVVPGHGLGITQSTLSMHGSNRGGVMVPELPGCPREVPKLRRGFVGRYPV